MTSHRPPWSVLVPVLDGDITAGALAHARALLAASDVRLAIVHVVDDREAAHGGAQRVAADAQRAARWRVLAALVPPARLLVDAVAGDPAAAILSQVDRFGSDLVVLGSPDAAGAQGGRTDRAIARVARAARCPVAVAAAASDREAPLRVAREPHVTARRPARPNGNRRDHADPFGPARRPAGRPRARAVV